jgi:DNA modification methylase
VADRRFLGIELNPDYATIARARIAHWCPIEQERDTGPFAHTA